MPELIEHTKQPVTADHWLTGDPEEPTPAGGCTSGVGICISWQNGPLGRGSGRRKPNGAFVEDLIAVCIDRIEFYNAAGFECDENMDAIGHLHDALAALGRRTASREAAGVEGTHERREGVDRG